MRQKRVSKRKALDAWASQMLRPKFEKGKDGDLKSPANMPWELKDAKG